MNKWLLLMGCLFVGGHAQADLRVLFRFDASGHFVHRVIQVTDRQELRRNQKIPPQNAIQLVTSLPTTVIERGRSWKNAQISPLRKKQSDTVDGFARLTWFDVSGLELAQTEVPDPRIVHSPSHAAGFNASRSRVVDGAWLASGPSLAASVTIAMPESTSLELAAEYWNLELPR